MFVPSLSWQNDLFFNAKLWKSPFPFFTCGGGWGGRGFGNRSQGGRGINEDNLIIARRELQFPAQNASSLFDDSFPYVRPEPVLVNRSFTHQSGSKKAFGAPVMRLAFRLGFVIHT